MTKKKDLSSFFLLNWLWCKISLLTTDLDDSEMYHDSFPQSSFLDIGFLLVSAPSNEGLFMMSHMELIVSLIY